MNFHNKNKQFRVKYGCVFASIKKQKTLNTKIIKLSISTSHIIPFSMLKSNVCSFFSTHLLMFLHNILFETFSSVKEKRWKNSHSSFVCWFFFLFFSISIRLALVFRKFEGIKKEIIIEFRKWKVNWKWNRNWMKRKKHTATNWNAEWQTKWKEESEICFEC